MNRQFLTLFKLIISFIDAKQLHLHLETTHELFDRRSCHFQEEKRPFYNAKSSL